MAKVIEIRNGDIVLSEAMEILRERVQNLSKLQYSLCCSPSGCLPSRMAVNSQGDAIGENLLRHSVPSSIVELFRGGQGLQCSGRYSLLRYSFCSSPSGCLPPRVAVNSQGAAIGENLLRHSVPLGGAIQSLQGSDRYFLRHRRKIRPPVPSCGAIQSLKGSDRYSLRHGRRIVPADILSLSLKAQTDIPQRHSPGIHTPNIL